VLEIPEEKLVMAGYSKNPLATKLGIKEHCRIAVFNAPKGFIQSLGQLPDGASLREDSRASAFDVMIFFTRSRAELVQRFLDPGRSPLPCRGPVDLLAQKGLGSAYGLD
jgi:hypothetical protein